MAIQGGFDFPITLRFENLAERDNLVRMSMTNLPQQARLSNLLAEEPEDRVEAIEEEPT